VTDESAEDHRAAVEAPIRAAIESGDLASGATAALRAYGDELTGYLRAIAGDADLAAEAFATLGEDMWRGLPAFRWESSLRSWLYTLARHALHRLRNAPSRRAARNIPLSLAPEAAAVVRTMTLDIQRTDVKDEFRVLREQLEPEDRELVLLRIERKLAWKDIARILGSADDDLAAHAAMLRKRYERVKERLRKLAIEHGIIEK
jgi:RNA polymerase sigma-70 factor (ECF subfamily)